MTCVFISNFFNHHQKPLSDALSRITDNNYHFIETYPMSDARKSLGWTVNDYPEYVKKIYESEETRRLCISLIDNADVVIIGSAPDELIKNRLKNGALTFRDWERIYKSGYEWYKTPKWLVSFYLKSGRHKSLYALCASAYTAADFAKTFTFLGKTYKWGYFPPAKHYDNIDALIDKKEPSSILWAGRLIDWKHAESAVRVAAKLKSDGYIFRLKIAGDGPLRERLKRQIEDEGLSGCVIMLGSLLPERVREYMEKSQIYLFTSDRNEGWGVVLNESMNSGCAVVASHIIGSAPFLIEHRHSGLFYRDGDFEDLYKNVKWLLDNDIERRKIGACAYNTITEQWNAENAAARFICLAEAIQVKNKKPDLFESGVCSKAPIIKDNWFEPEK